LRVARCGIESIVLVVILVLEKAEYACNIRWSDEDEYKDKYEPLCRFQVSGIINLEIGN